MTAEGIFPKVDGDILYASEVNKFVTCNNYCSGILPILGTGSIMWTNGSLVNITDEDTSTEWIGSIQWAGAGGCAGSIVINVSPAYYNSIFYKITNVQEDMGGGLNMIIYGKSGGDSTILKNNTVTDPSVSLNEKIILNATHKIDKIMTVWNPQDSGSATIHVYEMGLI